MLNKLAKVFLGILTQGIASIATMVLSIIVARSVPQADFGIFAITISTWIVVVGSIRASTAEVFLFDHSVGERHQVSIRISQSASAGLMLSLIAALGLVALGFIVPSAANAFGILAVGIPALFLQDANRFYLISEGRQLVALAVDVTYVISIVLTMVFLFTPGSLSGFLWLWVACSWVAGVSGVVLARYGISLRGATDWFSGQSRTIVHFFGDFVVANGVANAAVYFVAAWGSLADAAAIRGSQVLLVPILLVMRGASVALGGELARLASVGKRRRVLQAVGVLSLVQVVAVGAAGLVVSVVPNDIVRTLLGESSDVTLRVFPFAAAATLALGLATVAMIGLKAAGDVRQSLSLKLITAPLTLGMMTVGVFTDGAAGSQVGLAAGESLRTALQWRRLLIWQKN
ncbi:hypothetical protein [Pseudarthrobacter sp. CCNWLW207]|uniref:hypothetical protein n=1 Tax=Pseudarthrobacter sp. CCNWLW207 TaxID=3127468 RepID=UPI003077C567